jgi:molecular chaperone DnaK
MVKDAELHAEEDKARRDLIEARNGADSMVYAAERALRGADDRVDGTIRTEVQDKITAVRAALDGEDAEAIRNRTAELGVAMQKIGEAMYEAEGAPQPGAADTKSADDDVVEGEYKVD